METSGVTVEEALELAKRGLAYEACERLWPLVRDPATRDEAAESMQRSVRWAQRCRKRLQLLRSSAQTEVIVTRDSVPGLAPYAVLVADRWGEIVTAQRTGTPSELPGVERILAWVEFVQYQCPECQGETR